MKKYLALALAISILSALQTAAQLPGLKLALNVLEDQKADDYEVYTVNIDGT